ncbi:UDP-N-acetylglucosamine--N-acetylmuramyl-(pentapeptide) pyrophosphoryl-undecaprenol N-acetylglucosamine transferase, partial [Staphylococcus pseudintermedius]
LKHCHQQNGYALTGFTPNKKLLLVMGGSMGSLKINEGIRRHLAELLQTYQIIHLTCQVLFSSNNKQECYVQYECVNAEVTTLVSMQDEYVARAGATART